MKTLVSAAAALALTFGAAQANAACDQGEIVIKFSHVTNTDKHPKGIAASLLQKRVNAEMNGKACMEVFPNSTLYNDNKVLEALLNGDVQLAAPSLSKFEKLTKKFRIFDLPFMFKNIEAVEAFQASPTALNDSRNSETENSFFSDCSVTPGSSGTSCAKAKLVNIIIGKSMWGA